MSRYPGKPNQYTALFFFNRTTVKSSQKSQIRVVFDRDVPIALADCDGTLCDLQTLQDIEMRMFSHRL